VEKEMELRGGGETGAAGQVEMSHSDSGKGKEERRLLCS
jgi:hypothetical protein